MNGTDERELERFHRRAFARFVALILSPAPRSLRLGGDSIVRRPAQKRV